MLMCWSIRKGYDRSSSRRRIVVWEALANLATSCQMSCIRAVVFPLYRCWMSPICKHCGHR
ncbi:unnamed protein product [Gongylonema pulchrum]|uniref:Uncharacterized protein n=1 Tax=Gongylonema pulchrum TaxID=637853 RepID=A0A183E1R8_9BILA|nr:unnamed protein product [Gongylonema pulchrum]